MNKKARASPLAFFIAFTQKRNYATITRKHGGQGCNVIRESSTAVAILVPA
jgi:hypothetical protein